MASRGGGHGSGDALGKVVGQRFALDATDQRIAIAAGCAAGFTAAYNTPLAAILFVLEIVIGVFVIDAVVPIALATAVGDRAVAAAAALPALTSLLLADTAVTDAGGAALAAATHLELAAQVIDGLRAKGGGDIPVVVGGIVPKPDVARLEALGVRAVFTPADYDLAQVMGRMLDVVEGAAA